MALPIDPSSFSSMEARLAEALPEGPGWRYEPKWDGFRGLVFRDGEDVAIQSKRGQPLARYFPEVAEAVRAVPAKLFVVDGEIVVPSGKGFSFDDLLQRIHPAESRIRRLAAETPARMILFDLLVDDAGKYLGDRPLAERRKALEAFARKRLKKAPLFALSPYTDDLAQARRWLGEAGTRAVTDGVVAKRLESPYVPGERAMVKVKRLRTADCVVGGFRWAEGAEGTAVGSLLLGLYGEDGQLHHVGFTSSLAAAQRRELTRTLRPLRGGTGFTGRAPGGPSRWNLGRSTEWEPLRPEKVVEVRYDHFTGGRFRHGTKLLRWRPDKDPRACTMEQVEAESRVAILPIPA